MAAKYTDDEIELLLKEGKPLPPDYQARTQIKTKRGHKERELDIRGDRGNEFLLILRQSNFNPLDFSIILAFCPPKTNQTFRLRRYNGKSHEHTNKIEGGTFYDFHIHKATERYQERGDREDTYAEATDRFFDFHSAINCMFEDCSFDYSGKSQIGLF